MVGYIFHLFFILWDTFFGMPCFSLLCTPLFNNKFQCKWYNSFSPYEQSFQDLLHHTLISSLPFVTVSWAAVRGRDWAMCRPVPASVASLQFMHQRCAFPRERLALSAYEAKLWDWKCKYLGGTGLGAVLLFIASLQFMHAFPCKCLAPLCAGVYILENTLLRR